MGQCPLAALFTLLLYSIFTQCTLCVSNKSKLAGNGRPHRQRTSRSPLMRRDRKWQISSRADEFVTAHDAKYDVTSNTSFSLVHMNGNGSVALGLGLYGRAHDLTQLSLHHPGRDGRAEVSPGPYLSAGGHSVDGADEDGRTATSQDLSTNDTDGKQASDDLAVPAARNFLANLSNLSICEAPTNESRATELKHAFAIYAGILVIIIVYAIALITLGRHDPLSKTIFVIKFREQDRKFSWWPVSHLILYLVLGYRCANVPMQLFIAGVAFELFESSLFLCGVATFMGKIPKADTLDDIDIQYPPSQWIKGTWWDIVFNSVGQLFGMGMRRIVDRYRCWSALSLHAVMNAPF